MDDERSERAWKWVLRGLGVIGFGYLLLFNSNVPVAYYVLLGGLLGLPNIIAYQVALNRGWTRRERRKGTRSTGRQGEERDG